MLKKILITLSLLFAVSATPRAVYAVENCVTVYGGGVVCSAETENIVHKPVETDLGDVRPLVLGSVLIGTSFALFVLSRKIAQRASVITK